YVNVPVPSYDTCPSSIAYTIRPFIPSFFFNDTATTEIYTLSLHDALPIYDVGDAGDDDDGAVERSGQRDLEQDDQRDHQRVVQRSEEHTSELQSHLNLVCRLLLEKKKKKKNKYDIG